MGQPYYGSFFIINYSFSQTSITIENTEIKKDYFFKNYDNLKNYDEIILTNNKIYSLNGIEELNKDISIICCNNLFLLRVPQFRLPWKAASLIKSSAGDGARNEQTSPHHSVSLR